MTGDARGTPWALLARVKRQTPPNTYAHFGLQEEPIAAVPAEGETSTKAGVRFPTD